MFRCKVFFLDFLTWIKTQGVIWRYDLMSRHAPPTVWNIVWWRSKLQNWLEFFQTIRDYFVVLLSLLFLSWRRQLFLLRCLPIHTFWNTCVAYQTNVICYDVCLKPACWPDTVVEQTLWSTAANLFVPEFICWAAKHFALPFFHFWHDFPCHYLVFTFHHHIMFPQKMMMWFLLDCWCV